VSDQQPEAVNGETGTPGTGLATGSTVPSSSAPGEPVAAVAQPPRLVPEQEAISPTVDAPKVEAAGIETPKAKFRVAQILGRDCPERVARIKPD